MRVVLRVLNWLYAIAIVGYAMIIAAEGHGAAETAGLFVGASIWALAPALTLTAIRRAGKGVRWAGYTVNVLPLVGLTALGPFMYSGAALGYYLLGVLVFCAPLALNLWGIRVLSRPVPLNLKLVEDGPVTVATSEFDEATVPAAADTARQPTHSVAPSPGTTPVKVPNYFARHWRGDLSLPVSYWINGSLFGLLVMFAISMITASAEGMPLQEALTLIATGNDPLGRIEATISTDGRALILRGLFGEGSADKVRRLLEAALGIQTVMLESGGGRLKEADEVAALVAARELDTYVESHCESACTYVFLAGRDRAATPNAQIGFHQPSFPGLDAAAEYEMLQDMKAEYRRDGISQKFIGKLAVTPAEDMWYPTYDELIVNGVVNRVSTGGEVASLMTHGPLQTQDDFVRVMHQVPLFVAYERHFPGTIEQAAAAAMRVHASGGTDAELLSAARAVFAGRLPEVMAAANVEQLHAFAELSIDQLNAARAISDEACAMLMATTLDVSKVFPPELVQREFEWTLGVLEGPMMPQPPVRDADFEAALEPLLEIMPAQQLLAFGDPEAYADQRGLLCDSTINLYQTIMTLPEPEQSILLRAIFQAE